MCTPPPPTLEVTGKPVAENEGCGLLNKWTRHSPTFLVVYWPRLQSTLPVSVSSDSQTRRDTWFQHVLQSFNSTPSRTPQPRQPAVYEVRIKKELQNVETTATLWLVGSGRPPYTWTGRLDSTSPHGDELLSISLFYKNTHKTMCCVTKST